MISRPILLGSTGLALLLSGVAFAMPQVPIIPLDTLPGQTYITIDAQYSGVPEDDGFAFFEHCPFNGKMGGPGISSRGSRCDNSEKIALIDALDSIDAYGGGGIIGITGDHAWFNGNRQRFELGFGILSGDRSEKHSELFNNEPDALPVMSTFEGKGYEPCGESIVESPCGPRHLGIEAHVKSDYDAFNIVARTLIDFEVSPSFTITPNFGLVLRHSENNVNAAASWIDGPAYPDNTDSLTFTGGGGGSHSWLPWRNDRIKTNEIGVELGTTLSFNLSDSFKLFGGVNGEILYREGRFNRLSNGKHHQECDNEGPFLTSPSECNPSIALTTSGSNRRISDSLNDTAVNVTLSLGAAYSFRGGTTISVIGYAQNESHLVVTQNHSNNNNEPTLTSSGDYHRSSARLDSERDWTPGVVVALTIPFGGT